MLQYIDLAIFAINRKLKTSFAKSNSQLEYPKKNSSLRYNSLYGSLGIDFFTNITLFRKEYIIGLYIRFSSNNRQNVL